MERLVGIPYLQNGRSYEGADCWGIVFLYYRDILGRSVPSYVAEMDDREFRRGTGAVVEEERARGWVAISEPAAGDVVLMRNGAHHNHVGIYLDGRRTLHTDGPGLSAIERLDALHLRSRVSGFYRLLEC
jgi:murein DD-endopeptidase